jgi:hypothetical protein
MLVSCAILSSCKQSEDESDTLAATRKPLAQLIEFHGKVEFKRENGKTWQRATVGTNLYHGDLVRAANGSKGIFRCTTNSRQATFDSSVPMMGVASVCAAPR